MENDLIITPEEFKKALKSILENPKMAKRLADCTKQTEAGKIRLWEYTRIWDTPDNGVYAKLAKRLKLECKLEHSAIERRRYDAVFFQKNALCPVSDKAGVRPCARLLSLVIEHECCPHSAYEEVGKLHHVNSPLKVLITYPQVGDSNKKRFGEYAEQLRGWKDYVKLTCPDFWQWQKFIVVLGWWHEEGERYEWVCRLFNGKKFKFEEME